jgi:hypothetical protein
LFEYISDELKKDKEFILEIITFYGTLFKYALNEKKNYKDVIYEAFMNVNLYI